MHFEQWNSFCFCSCKDSSVLNQQYTCQAEYTPSSKSTNVTSWSEPFTCAMHESTAIWRAQKQKLTKSIAQWRPCSRCLSIVPSTAISIQKKQCTEQDTVASQINKQDFSTIHWLYGIDQSHVYSIRRRKDRQSIATGKRIFVRLNSTCVWHDTHDVLRDTLWCGRSQRITQLKWISAQWVRVIFLCAYTHI